MLADICLDMCIHLCVGLCADLCPHTAVEAHVYRHVYRHVHTLVCRLVYGPVPAYGSGGACGGDCEYAAVCFAMRQYFGLTEPLS